MIAPHSVEKEMRFALDELHERLDHKNAADLWGRLSNFRKEVEDLQRSQEAAAQEAQREKVAESFSS